jgi:predicted secreted hydrolase
MNTFPWSRIALLVGVGLVLAPFLARDASPPRFSGGLDVARLMAGRQDPRWSRVEGPRAFTFPADHGPHPDHQLEWWYLTGQVTDAEGRRYGFQFTIFRHGLTPEPAERSSAWATRDLYLGHFALTSAARQEHRSFERLQRGGALGLGGARAPGPGRSFRVWVDGWELRGPPRGEAIFPLRLEAETDGHALSLVLKPRKPVVLQGERGYSRKGREAGNASYYHSFTRLEARGSLRFAGEEAVVTGTAWMDHEWSTSALSEDLAGWDWFSLHFDDGRELMLYGMRRKDGGWGAFSAGALVRQDGSVRRLGREEFAIRPRAHWRSPRSGARYPARWTLSVPDEDLEVEVRPLVADQEMDVSVRYWEGAVSVRGTQGAASISGHGYVELVGYEGTGTR